MENLLIVLIFIGSIIYKLYSNYKKELEKAKTRNPNQRPVNQGDTYAEPIPQQVRDISRPIPTPKEVTYSYENSIPEEVMKMRESKKMPRLKRDKSETEEAHIPQKHVEFDLREAVIQAAILERPYQ